MAIFRKNIDDMLRIKTEHRERAPRRPIFCPVVAFLAIPPRPMSVLVPIGSQTSLFQGSYQRYGSHGEGSPTARFIQIPCRSGTGVDFVGAWFDINFLVHHKFVEKIKVHSEMSGIFATHWQLVAKIKFFVALVERGPLPSRSAPLCCWIFGSFECFSVIGRTASVNELWIFCFFALDLLGCNSIFAPLDKHRSAALSLVSIL